MPSKLTPEIITAAILGFEEQKRHIDTQIAELRAVLTGGSTKPAAPPEPPERKRRKMSAAGRKAISEATKKRWAAFHAAKAASQAPPSKRATRKVAKKKVACQEGGSEGLVEGDEKGGCEETIEQSGEGCRTDREGSCPPIAWTRHPISWRNRVP